jgi:hypothetical protein
MVPRALRLPALAALWLLAGLVAGRQASEAWRSVVRYATPYRFPAKTDAGHERSWRVLLVVIDGLRLDASRRMPGLGRFRAVGADLTAAASLPSYSRPGRATLVTGAPPEIHGVTTNRFRGDVSLDNLFRGLARTQGEIAIVGTPLWGEMFRPDLGRAFMRESDLQGRFEQALPGIARAEWEAAGILLERKPRLGVLDLVLPDLAAHEYGASSPQYGRACAVSDRVLQRLFDEVDLFRTLVVITADHGHLDQGGHGGDEDEVRRIPLVLAGRGIREAVRGAARQTDVAPTIAALTGLPIPAGSEGRPLTEIIDFEQDAAFEASLADRAAAQRTAFRRDFAASLGVPEADPDDARSERQRRETWERIPRGLGVLAAALIVLALAHRDRPAAALAAAAAGTALDELLFRGLLAWEGLRPSLSAINHEEDVRPYFTHLMGLAFAAALVSLAAVGLAAGRLRGFRAGASLAFAATGGIFLLLLLRVLVVYWPAGLEMTYRIDRIGRGFGAVVDLGRIQALGLAALGVPVFAWLGARFPRRAAAAAAVLGLVLPLPARGGGIHEVVPDAAAPGARWAIFLHGRVVEVQGRKAVHPEFGPYAFDAILEALAGRGLEVVAQVRPESTTFEYSTRVAGQARKLKAAGVPSRHITVIGFSKGGALARRAAAELRDPEVGFVILAGCPKREEGLEPWVPKMAGRMLSLYDASDELVGSCTPAFAKAPAVKGAETVLEVGRRHGTFFDPRPEWLDPVVAFAKR